MEKKTNRRQRTRTFRPLLRAGGMAAVAFLWGCLSPVSVPAPGGKSADVPSRTENQGSENQGSENPNSLSPAAPETGVAGEEFIITLGIGDNSSRSVVGPGAGGILSGGIRNIVQVIVVNAGTGDVVYFQQEVRQSDADASAALTVQNLWAGQRYHFLVLTGHRERDYSVSGNYAYKAGPPTLLAAGLLADREIKRNDKKETRVGKCGIT